VPIVINESDQKKSKKIKKICKDEFSKRIEIAPSTQIQDYLGEIKATFKFSPKELEKKFLTRDRLLIID
jgi:hypothetical protein